MRAPNCRTQDDAPAQTSGKAGAAAASAAASAAAKAKGAKAAAAPDWQGAAVDAPGETVPPYVRTQLVLPYEPCAARAVRATTRVCVSGAHKNTRGGPALSPCSHHAGTATARSSARASTSAAATAANGLGKAAANTSSNSNTNTVFVRGLGLDATAAELQSRLSLFGAVKACRCSDACLPHSGIHACVCVLYLHASCVWLACGVALPQQLKLSALSAPPVQPVFSTGRVKTPAFCSFSVCLCLLCLCALHRLVLDKASGKPKGTAFVEFREAAAATKAAEACARGR